MLRDLSRVIQLLSVGDGIFIPLLNPIPWFLLTSLDLEPLSIKWDE